MSDHFTSGLPANLLWGVVAFCLGASVYFGLVGEDGNNQLSAKAKQAKEMRLAFNSIEKKNRNSNAVVEKVSLMGIVKANTDVEIQIEE